MTFHRPFRRQIRFTREMKNLPRNVKLISLMMFIYYIGWGISEPFMNIYFKDILGSYTALGFIAGLLPLFGIIWALTAARFEDRIHKNKLISSILLLYLPISFIILNLRSLLSFVSFRFYHAFLATNLWLSSETFLRKYSVKNKTAESIGLFDSAFGLSLIIGPIIGGLLIAEYSYKIFYTISLFAFLAFLVSLNLRDKIKVVKKKPAKISFKQEFKDFYNNKKLFHLASFHFFLTISSAFLIMLLPLFYKELGASFLQIGILTSLFYIPQIFESFFSTLQNKKRAVMISLLSAAVLALFLFKIQNIYLLLIIAFLLGLCLSCIGPIIQGKAASYMPRNKIGQLYGVQYSMIHLASAIGPFFAGIIADNLGLNYIFIIAAIIYSLLFIVNFSKKLI